MKNRMIKNYVKDKRGLSAVVTTLILVLLVIVAVAIVWGVLSNLISSRTDDINTVSKCLDVQVRPVNVICSTAGVCTSATLQRSGTGDFTIGGVRLEVTK